ncbi:DUF3299 domain-containing protein [Rubritalea tangerina]|uniref:DUF3299 domain-containing protein n=2 Tax=Rubritalea tangerina TaxID=430798 RepID=A0ABW4ZB12_9BACT
MKRAHFLSAIVGVGFFVGSAFAEEARKIEWDGMKATYEFDDPFVDLTSEQLMNLSMVARVRMLEERAKETGKPVSEEMLKEKRASEKLLKDQKVDIDGLLAKRDEIREQRKKRANMGVEELDGKLVSLPGFVLPLEFDGKKVKEFLLVPWVGACIHTPPPPPNQIVHVIVAEPFATKGTFEAVTITGKMQLKKQVRELFLVDGTADINMSYAMESAAVEKYEAPGGGEKK